MKTYKVHEPLSIVVSEPPSEVILSHEIATDSKLLTEIANLQKQLEQQEVNINNLIKSQTADIKDAIISRKDIEELHVRKSVDQPKIPNVTYVCDPFNKYIDNYVEETLANDLIKFCDAQKYRPENGHNVIMFGEEYNYSRNQQSERPAPRYQMN